MKFDYMKQKNKLFSLAMSCISVLLAVLIFIKITSYHKQSASAQNIEDLIRTIKTEDNNKPDTLNKSTKDMLTSLKSSNLFAPPPEKRNPVTEIRCILGNEAFINDRYYKEGEMCQDAKIVRIEATQVTIEWDGKTTVLRPLDAAMASSGPSSPSSISSGRTPPVSIERPSSVSGNLPISVSGRGTISARPEPSAFPERPVQRAENESDMAYQARLRSWEAQIRQITESQSSPGQPVIQVEKR